MTDWNIPTGQLRIEAVRPGDQRGGQHVGTAKGVRITHLPTDTVAEAHGAWSQHKNREVAMEMIVSALTSPHMRGPA